MKTILRAALGLLGLPGVTPEHGRNVKEFTEMRRHRLGAHSVAHRDNGVVPGRRRINGTQ